MKRIVFFTLLLLFLQNITVHAQIDWDAVIDDYVEKYQPEKIPKWTFPMIFQNGFGERDTIYFNYDPEADGFFNGNDTIFGQKYAVLDTATFQVFIDKKVINDTSYILDMYTTSYSNMDQAFNGGLIQFNKGRLPIRAYFDATLFNSDSLPITTQDGLPKLQGELSEPSTLIRIGTWNDQLGNFEYFCPFDYPVLLADTAESEICTFPDSLSIGSIDPNIIFDGPGDVLFLMKPWTGRYVSIGTLLANNFKIYPNPADDFLTIEFDQAQSGKYQLFNIAGKLMYNEEFITQEKIQIPTIGLQQGLYFLLFKKDRKITASRKIVVLH